MSDVTQPDPPQYEYGGRPIVIGKSLGRGAQGTVYQARIQQPDKSWGEIALKVSNKMEDHDPHFGDDAEALDHARGKIRNTVIPSQAMPLVSENGSWRQASYMPLVRGHALDQEIDSNPQPFSPHETAGILAQMSQTVRDAEKQGLVHADIKPGNVIYNPATKTATTVDWGMVSEIDEKNIAGTYLYMAPEVAKGEGITPKSDVYSLGMSGAQMLTKRPPKNTPMELYNAPEQAYVDWAANYQGGPQVRDPYMRAVIHRAIHPDLEKRSSPLDLMTDLAAYPEARRHYSSEDMEEMSKRLVERASNMETRHSLVDSNAARGLSASLPIDHPLQKNLIAVASLGPSVVDPSQKQQQPSRQKATTPEPEPVNDPSPAPAPDVVPSFRSSMRR